MRVTERPDDIMKQFEMFYRAIDKHDYTQADKLLNDLEELIGDDPELAAMRIQLDLEQI